MNFFDLGVSLGLPTFWIIFPTLLRIGISRYLVRRQENTDEKKRIWTLSAQCLFLYDDIFLLNFEQTINFTLCTILYFNLGQDSWTGSWKGWFYGPPDKKIDLALKLLFCLVWSLWLFLKLMQKCCNRKILLSYYLLKSTMGRHFDGTCGSKSMGMFFQNLLKLWLHFAETCCRLRKNDPTEEHLKY